MLRILVIDESRARAAELCGGLAMVGHQVAAVLPSALDLTAQIERIKPDIILIETESPSRDTDVMRAAFKAGVSAYVVDNLDMARLRPIIDVAIARFDSHQSVKQELAVATRKLSKRKVVEQAKGILMKTRGLSEDEAYAARRKLAMELSQPLGKVAGDLLAMAKLLL